MRPAGRAGLLGTFHQGNTGASDVARHAVKNQSQTTADIAKAYDQVPYRGGAYYHTHPRHLSAIGQLFGLKPAAPTKARILEIGCASGANLIPMAAMHPQSSCVGIDISERQIADGRTFIDELKLANVRLEQMSVADVTRDLGKFDYILCHGVFSWVPDDVRTHILRVCKQNLAANGIAYISYNTRPGWAAVSALRDMMCYHTAQFADPKQKIEEAVRMLRFALEGARPDDVAWRQVIQSELAVLGSAGGDYLFHEHLEEHNAPLYFHEFAEMAGRQGLRYAGDAALSEMYVGNLPASAAATLSQLTDVVRQEQYMDFLRNRRFRMSLITHADQPVNFNLQAQQLLDFHLTAQHLAPDFNPTEQNWEEDVSRSFGGGFSLAHDRFGAMLLVVLNEQGERPIAAGALIDETARRLGTDDLGRIRSALVGVGLQLAFHGRIVLHSGPSQAVATLSERPEAWFVARYQAQNELVITNLLHQAVNMDPLGSLLLLLVDGTRTRDELIPAFSELLESRAASFTLSDGTAVNDAQTRAAMVEATVDKWLGLLLSSNLLVA